MTLRAVGPFRCGCGKITIPFADEGQLTSIAISGDTVVQVGDTIRLSARGTVAGVIGIFGFDRVPDAVWSISDHTIASIAPVKQIAGDTTSGSAIILTGLQQGRVQVAAAARGVKGSIVVRINSRGLP